MRAGPGDGVMGSTIEMTISRAVAAFALLFLPACGSERATEAKEPVGGKLPEQSPPPNTVGGFTIDIPETTLAPGEELEPCWIFPLEIEGPSRFVAAARLDTGEGMHHGNITTRKKTGDGIRPCGPGEGGIVGGEAGDIINGGAVLFGSSTQLVGSEWHRFPDGMAYRVKDGYEIVARMHYLNVTTKPVTVTPKYQWYTIPEADVVHEIQPFAWVLKGFAIPPKSTHSVSTDCWLYEPMKVVDAMPHMHALGDRFSVGFLGGSRDGELFLDDQGFDEASDIYSFDPAVDLSQGDGVTFGCTWKNTFDKTIVEGVGDNEMCILFGYGYPAENTFSIAATEEKCTPVLPPPPDAP